MSRNDATDTTALWREALEVMGYEVADNDSDLCAIVPRDGGWIWYVDLEDTWNLFGLAVEWIDERKGLRKLSINETLTGYSLSLIHHAKPSDYFSTHADTLPTAAALLVVEHGAKIAKETT
jgi:hypothetical protein